MERSNEARYHFKLTTNGLLIDDAFLEFAKRNDVLIAMSFDGVPEAQNRHRLLKDGSPSFEVLYSRLKGLLEARPYATILSVVNPDTAPYLSESVAFLIDTGCRYLVVSLNHDADWTKHDFAVLEKQYRRLAKMYVKWTKQGMKFYFSPFEVKLSSHINRHSYHRDRCELAKRQLSVDPEGFLYPCVQFTRGGPDSAWCIGSVRDGIDVSARARIREASEREKGQCRDCAIKNRCNNTCGCLNWQTTQSINEISPVLCRHEQMLVRIADRIGESLYAKRTPLFLQKHYNDAYPAISLLEEAISILRARQK